MPVGSLRDPELSAFWRCLKRVDRRHDTLVQQLWLRLLMLASTGKRVFVLGAHLPCGGTYMAYHVGVILHRWWAYRLVATTFDSEPEGHGVWEYDVPFATIGMTAMQEGATKDDVLIANPSFSNQLLGLGFPGKTIMYVQGITSFSVIDGFFDKYVAVSPFVQRFLYETYNMEVPVIPPFVHHDHMEHRIPAWETRPEGSVATIVKSQQGTPINRALLDQFRALLGRRYPDLPYSMTLVPPGTPHRELLQSLSRHRYFLSLSPVEGFGLVPLEAMLCGCAVLGFHGGGGLAYLRHHCNALVCSYPDMGRLVDLFHELLTGYSLAKHLVSAGPATASKYTLDIFQRRWRDQLTPLLGRPIAPSLG